MVISFSRLEEIQAHLLSERSEREAWPTVLSTTTGDSPEMDPPSI
jgi:hypothetical protein